MKLAQRLRELEKAEKLIQPKNEEERLAQIAVAFASLKNCDIWCKSMNLMQDHSMMEIEVTFFTPKPFPHTLVYEQLHGGFTSVGESFAAGGVIKNKMQLIAN